MREMQGVAVSAVTSRSDRLLFPLKSCRPCDAGHSNV